MLQAASMTIMLALTAMLGWERYESVRQNLQANDPAVLSRIGDLLKPSMGQVGAFGVLGFGALLMIVFCLLGFTDRYFNDEIQVKGDKAEDPILAHPRKWAGPSQNFPTWYFLGWMLLCLVLGGASLLGVFFINAFAEGIPYQSFATLVVVPTIGSFILLGGIAAATLRYKHGTLGKVRNWKPANIPGGNE